jgi:hypothetical protein
MKHLRRLGGGLLLVLALSIPAFAGEVDTPGIAGEIETPGLTGDTQETPTPGDMHTPGLVGEIGIPGLSLILATLFG